MYITPGTVYHGIDCSLRVSPFRFYQNHHQLFEVKYNVQTSLANNVVMRLISTVLCLFPNDAGAVHVWTTIYPHTYPATLYISWVISMVINMHGIIECKLCRVSSNVPGHELALARFCAGARFGST